jgi:hypothetical protein
MGSVLLPQVPDKRFFCQDECAFFIDERPFPARIRFSLQIHIPKPMRNFAPWHASVLYP